MIPEPETVDLWGWARAAAWFSLRRSSDATSLGIVSLVALTLGALAAGAFPPSGIVLLAHFALWVSGLAYLRWLMPVGQKLRPSRIILGTAVASAVAGAAVLFALASLSRGVPTLGDGFTAISALPSLPLAIVLAVPAVVVGRRLSEMQLIREPVDTDLARRTEAALSVVFHELRRPLTVLVSSSEIALDPGIPADDRRDLLESIHRNALRLNDYLEELLESARIQSRRRSIHSEPVDMADLVRHVVHELVDPTLRHEIQTEYPASIVCVGGDPARLKMIVRNLTTNAIRYSPDGSVVRVSLRKTGSRISLTVEDNGAGIAEEYREKIFDQFYRIPGSQPSGFGLGLYVTKQLVIAHGGTIIVEKVEPQGARFVVSLPAAREAERRAIGQPAPEVFAPRSDPRGQLEPAHIGLASTEDTPEPRVAPSTRRPAPSRRSSRRQRGRSS